MHFANQNLLSLMHQSLDTQHVTAAYFTRYARSPETRTFNNYFRLSRTFFATYLRKRPHYSLSRYITVHRRKKNPILCNFTSQIKTTILSSLQSLRQLQKLSPCKGGLPRRGEGVCESLCSLWQNKKTQNKPNFKTTQITLTPSAQNTSAHCLRPSAYKNKPNSNPIEAVRTPNPNQRSDLERFIYVPKGTPFLRETSECVTILNMCVCS